MAAHSSILAWRTPWTEEPGGLLSMSCRVRHDWPTTLTPDFEVLWWGGALLEVTFSGDANTEMWPAATLPLPSVSRQAWLIAEWVSWVVHMLWVQKEWGHSGWWWLKIARGFLRFTYCEAYIYSHVQAQFEKWHRDWIQVSCTARQILYFWATREIPQNRNITKKKVDISQW